MLFIVLLSALAILAFTLMLPYLQRFRFYQYAVLVVFPLVFGYLIAETIRHGRFTQGSLLLYLLLAAGYCYRLWVAIHPPDAQE